MAKSCAEKEGTSFDIQSIAKDHKIILAQKDVVFSDVHASVYAPVLSLLPTNLEEPFSMGS